MEKPAVKKIDDNQRMKLPVVIVGGFHDEKLSRQLARSLPSFVRPYFVPVTQGKALSPVAVHQWLVKTFGQKANSQQLPIVGIGFSAGVVGLAGALAIWRQQGGTVARLVAVDGWGVPAVGVPIVRFSHDRFTHLTTLPLDAVADLLGEASKVNFYADPAVDHLSLWGEPEAVQGRQVERWELDENAGVPMSAADFLKRVLRAEWNQAFSWRTAVESAVDTAADAAGTV